MTGPAPSLSLVFTLAALAAPNVRAQATDAEAVRGVVAALAAYDYGVEPVVRADVAWASFRYDLSTDTPPGRVEVEGRGTAVLERMDGRWRVVHLHTSGRRKP